MEKFLLKLLDVVICILQLKRFRDRQKDVVPENREEQERGAEKGDSTSNPQE